MGDAIKRAHEVFRVEQGSQEPDRWYARFEVYRALGPTRTIIGAYRRCAFVEGLSGTKPSSEWYRQAKMWQWRERAEAWDQVSAERSKATPHEHPALDGVTRAKMIETLLRMVFRSLEVADLEGMETEEARAKLPAIRMLFKDLVAAHREEDRERKNVEDDAGYYRFCADELIAAQRELEKWREQRSVDSGSSDGASADDPEVRQTAVKR